MLPTPSFSFTIPSIHDDIALECRVYHPIRFRHHADTSWKKKGAVIAHPYAPLGGCFDDPVVQAVAATVLKKGFVVGTFNFRGAGGSKGRTSWNAKPELTDYISFVGFFIHYLHNLDPSGASLASETPTSPLSSPLSPIQSSLPFQADPFDTVKPSMILILGGYSYGSLITTSLPSIEAILSQFAHVAKGTAAAEIRLRALHLSTQWNIETQQQRKRGRSLNVDSLPRSRSIAFGGDESEPGTRRVSRESRRSIDVVRRSMDRSAKRLSFRKQSSDEALASPSLEESLAPIEIPTPQIHYLLISPLLPPISMFVTMFTKLGHFRVQHEREPRVSEKMPASAQDRLMQHPTLAVYGDKDFFTSQRKLRKWAEQLAEGRDSRFRFVEISEAGHFWHEEGVEARMREAVRDWIGDI